MRHQVTNPHKTIVGHFTLVHPSSQLHLYQFKEPSNRSLHAIVNASLKVVIMGKYQAMQTEPSKQISEKKSLYFLPSFADPSKNAACYRLYKIQWEGGQRSTSHNCTVGLYETGSENFNRYLAVWFYLAGCWRCSLVPDLFAPSRQLLCSLFAVTLTIGAANSTNQSETDQATHGGIPWDPLGRRDLSPRPI